MKHLLSITIFLLIFNQAVNAQQFETSIDKNGEKVLKGVLTREIIESDTSLKWYTPNLKGYTPNSLALAALNKYRDSVHIVVFMGTWCEDSHFIIPKLFTLLDAAGFPRNRVSLIGTDRDKKTLGLLSEAMSVTSVPTLLVMKNGNVVGRVVEYGKYGMWDKELGEVIQSSFAN